MKPYINLENIWPLKYVPSPPPPEGSGLSQYVEHVTLDGGGEVVSSKLA